MIYPKGSTTGTAISFTLPYPERCDFISASGDIYSAEGDMCISIAKIRMPLIV
jgi:hypothetical protein